MTRLTPPDISLRSLIRLAGPIFISNVAIVGGGTIDTIMAGQLGQDHLAAIALALAATISVTMALAGTLQSLSPIVGHHFGARKYPEIGRELQQNIWLALMLSFIGVPLLAWTDLWTGLGHVSGEVARMASQYLIFSAVALPFSLFSRTFVSLNAAVSRPRITMWISLALIVLRVPFNAVFMYGWFGMPALGGAGAGLTAAVLNFFAFIAFWLIWTKDPYFRPMHAPRIERPDFKLIAGQLHIGIPIGLSTFFEVSCFMFMAIFISRIGSEVVSAHQIVANITSLCYMVPLSLGISTAVLIAQSLGAKWPAVANTALLRSLRLTLGLALTATAVLFFGRNWIVSFYTSEAGVHQWACSLLIFGCIYHVFDAFQSVCSFSLRSYRVTKVPMIIYGVMLWGIGLCGGYWLAFGAESLGGPYGAYGFWSAITVGLILTGSVLGLMAVWVGRQRAGDENHTPEEVAAWISAPKK